jgi:hypothetical protein
MLAQIDLEYIANLRHSKCNKKEQFFAMVIRAIQNDPKTIYIKSPYTLLGTLGTINGIVSDIKRLKTEKEVIFLDTYHNATHYKDCGCHIIK